MVASTLFSKIPIVDTGRKAFPQQEVGNQVITVNFNRTFTSAPIVVACWNENVEPSLYMQGLSVYDITTTGFKATSKRLNASYGWPINWIAILA